MRGPPPGPAARRRVLAVVVAAVAVGVVGVVALTHSPGPRRVSTGESASRTTEPPAPTRPPVTTTTSVPPTTPITTDPGVLPQTGTLPTATTPAFPTRMAALWSGVTTGLATEALPAFFPESAYVQLKDVADSQGDFTDRLQAEYENDVLAAHQLLGAEAATARYLGVDVDESYAHWVPAGVCDNGIGYYEVPNSRLVYSVDGQLRSFGIASMISWRGEWYVVHLGAILRTGGGGTVDSAQIGPGAPTYSSTC